MSENIRDKFNLGQNYDQQQPIESVPKPQQVDTTLTEQVTSLQNTEDQIVETINQQVSDSSVPKNNDSLALLAKILGDIERETSQLRMLSENAEQNYDSKVNDMDLQLMSEMNNIVKDASKAFFSSYNEYLKDGNKNDLEDALGYLDSINIALNCVNQNLSDQGKEQVENTKDLKKMSKSVEELNVLLKGLMDAYGQGKLECGNKTDNLFSQREVCVSQLNQSGQVSNPEMVETLLEHEEQGLNILVSMESQVFKLWQNPGDKDKIVHKLDQLEQQFKSYQNDVKELVNRK